MYKPRGRPHEAKNVALDQQRMSLAEAVQVSPITKTPSIRRFPLVNPRSGATPIRQITHFGRNSVETEIRHQKHHFEAFREAYQERVCGRRVVYDHGVVLEQRPLDNAAPDSDTFEPEPLMRQFLSRYGVRKISDIKKPALAPLAKLTPKAPALVRNTIRTIKPQYPLQKLEFGADFIQEPPKTDFVELPKPILKKRATKNVNSNEAIKELKNIESRLTDSINCDNQLKNQKSSVYTSQDREELFKQLQATENQISVATSQLQAIQKILQDKRMLSTVQEEEESEDNEKSCQTDKGGRNPRVKWKVKPTLRGSQNKRTRLVDTLNMLNNRIQNMQDKYFNTPKVQFRTYDQIVNERKDEKKARKGVETIYRNMKYDRDSAMDLDLHPTLSSELRQLLHKSKTNFNVKRGKSEPKTKTKKGQLGDSNVSCEISKNSAAVITPFSNVAVNESKSTRDTTLTGSSNMTTSTSTNTNSTGKFDVKNLKSSEELLSEISCTDVLFAPRKISNDDGVAYNNIMFNDDYDELEEDEQDDYDAPPKIDAVNTDLEKSIEKSIKASNYLQKEFDTLRGDYGLQLDDMLVTKAKNVRFSEPHDIVERMDKVCTTPKADRMKHMFSKFDLILKDSLYSTAATTGN